MSIGYFRPANLLNHYKPFHCKCIEMTMYFLQKSHRSCREKKSNSEHTSVDRKNMVTLILPSSRSSPLTFLFIARRVTEFLTNLNSASQREPMSSDYVRSPNSRLSFETAPLQERQVAVSPDLAQYTPCLSLFWRRGLSSNHVYVFTHQPSGSSVSTPFKMFSADNNFTQ